MLERLCFVLRVCVGDGVGTSWDRWTR